MKKHPPLERAVLRGWAPWLAVGLTLVLVGQLQGFQSVATLDTGSMGVAYGHTGIAATPLSPDTTTLILPYGELWALTRGYNTASHIDYGMDWYDDRYALDFAQEACGAWGQPLYAIRPGTVVEAGYSYFGYGNVVLIDHGDGHRSRYAHMERIDVDVGQTVTRDEVLGLSGNTGNVRGVACSAHPGAHLHLAYYLEGVGVKPEPMSGHVEFKVECSYGREGVSDC